MEKASAHASWKDWFLQHGPKLLLCARQWTRSLADAEDVVQEAFVRFWRHQRGLDDDPQRLLFTSLRRAAIDLARRDTRRARREAAAGEDLAGPSGWFEHDAEQAERVRAIEAAIRRLPTEQREVLVLKIWGELTFEEIARELDIPANTAASRYRYALGGLRKDLLTVDCHG